MLRRIINTRRRKVIAGTMSALLVGAAAAFAAWLITGSGPGVGKIGSLQALQVTAGPVPGNGDSCFPGGTCPASVVINNPNAALVITSVESDGSSPSSPGCTASFLQTRTQTGLSIPLPSGSAPMLLPDVFSLAESAPTGCQGAQINGGLKITASTP